MAMIEVKNITKSFNVKKFNKETNKYEKDVLTFEARPSETGKIVFYGSSGFTRWTEKYHHRPLEEDIRMKDGSPAAVNHGFGGSTAEEGLYYYDRLVKPWEPRALVIATYANDGMYGYSPEQVMDVLARLLAWARTDFPGIKLFLVEPHPNPKGKETTMPDKWNNGLHKRRSFIQMLDAFHTATGTWTGSGMIQLGKQGLVQHFPYQTGFAGTADTGDADERAQGEIHIDPLEVVAPRPPYRELLAVALAALSRDGDLLIAIEVTSC